MSTDLNNTLTEFYARSGTVTPAVKWLNEHEYGQSFDDSEENFMLR